MISIYIYIHIIYVFKCAVFRGRYLSVYDICVNDVCIGMIWITDKGKLKCPSSSGSLRTIVGPQLAANGFGPCKDLGWEQSTTATKVCI